MPAEQDMPPRVITVATQKGGVGKTTVAVNLAAAIAGHFGRRTYLADFDAQCNATQYMMGALPSGTPTIQDVLESGLPFREAATRTPHSENLWIVPGSPELAFLDRQVAEAGKWQVAVRELPRLIRRSLPEDADIVVLDTPPSLGLWLQMALGVTDDVVVAANPEEFSLVGMTQLLETVQRVRETLNPRLNVAAVVLNKVRSRTNEHDAYIEAFRSSFGSHVLSPVLPLRTAIPESQREHIPLEFYGPSQDARTLFRELARELLVHTGLDSPDRKLGRAS